MWLSLYRQLRIDNYTVTMDTLVKAQTFIEGELKRRLLEHYRTAAEAFKNGTLDKESYLRVVQNVYTEKRKPEEIVENTIDQIIETLNLAHLQAFEEGIKRRDREYSEMKAKVAAYEQREREDSERKQRQKRKWKERIIGIFVGLLLFVIGVLIAWLNYEPRENEAFSIWEGLKQSLKTIIVLGGAGVVSVIVAWRFEPIRDKYLHWINRNDRNDDLTAEGIV